MYPEGRREGNTYGARWRGLVPECAPQSWPCGSAGPYAWPVVPGRPERADLAFSCLLHCCLSRGIAPPALTPV